MAKESLYDEGVRVALMVMGPQVLAGHTVSLPVTNIDLLPTVLEAAGLGKWECMSFLTLLNISAQATEY